MRSWPAGVRTPVNKEEAEFAAAALRAGPVTEPQVAECRRMQEEAAAAGRNAVPLPLLLYEKRYLQENQVLALLMNFDRQNTGLLPRIRRAATPPKTKPLGEQVLGEPHTLGPLGAHCRVLRRGGVRGPQFRPRRPGPHAQRHGPVRPLPGAVQRAGELHVAREVPELPRYGGGGLAARPLRDLRRDLPGSRDRRRLRHDRGMPQVRQRPVQIDYHRYGQGPQKTPGGDPVAHLRAGQRGLMRAIISDVHSNMEALEAVLSDIADQGAEGPLPGRHRRLWPRAGGVH